MATNGFSSLKRSVAYSAILCGALAGCASTDQQASKAELSPAQANLPHPATATAAAGVATTTPDAAATTAVASAGTAPASNEAATALSKSPRVQTAISQSPHGNAPLVATVQTPKVEPSQISAAQDRMAQTQTAQPASQSRQAQVAISAITGATTTNTSASAAYAPSDEPPPPSMVAIPTPNPSRPGDLAMLQPVTGSAVDAAYAPIPLTPEMVAIQSVVPMPRPGDAPGVEATMVASAAPPSQLAALSYADSRPQYDYNFDTTGPVVIPAVLSERDNDDSSVPPAQKNYISQLIQKYAKLYQVPEALIHRVVHRESRYDPKAYNNAGYFGLMQIKYNTAKSMGYGGPASGLFDAETNIKYAAKYLSGAWKVADNKQDDAVRLYARGYYYDAKNKGMMDIATGNY